MSDTITEPARTLPVTGSYDVAVVGGGIAGVAAALAAARSGARTVLIERSFGLGGLATLGNIIRYEPLCDGAGHQVIGGLGEELLKRSVAELRATRKPARFILPPACWQPDGDLASRARQRYIADFNPFYFMIAMEEMLAEAGVELRYDTRLCACVRSRDRITHLIIEDKEGRSAIACRTAIDASGDADLCALAGEATATLATNVLAGWHYVLENGELKCMAMTKPFSDDGTPKDSEGPLFSGVIARDVTAHTVQARALIMARIRARCAKDPALDLQPFALPAQPDFRMTRRLAAPFTLGVEHAHTWFDDAIGLTGDWRSTGLVWALPYRCLRAEANRNLLTAGRCISSAGRAWDMSRVIPTCAVTGEAAGTAAALAARTDGDLHALPVAQVQEQLRRQRVILDPALIRR